MKTIYVIVIVLTMSFTIVKGQVDTNFYDLVSTFYADSLNLLDSSEGGEAAEFLRFEQFWAPRVAPSGSFKLAGEARQNYIQEHFDTAGTNARLAHYTDNWEPLGPYGAPNRTSLYISGAANHSQGNGRMLKLMIDPDDPDHTVYSCSYNGGLWKGVDNGSGEYNWTPQSDNLPFIGNGDVTIITKDILSVHHKFVFVSSGPNYNGPSWAPPPQLGVGVYRSDNGGVWKPVTNGMIDNTVKNININRLLANPDDPDEIYAATDLGLYKTTNATSDCDWTYVSSLASVCLTNEKFRGLAFKPNSSTAQVIYVSGQDVYMSTDAGATWSSMGLRTATGNTSKVVNIDVLNETGHLNDVYAHVFNGIQYIYKYNGTTWSNIGTLYKYNAYAADHLAVSVMNSSTIYAGTDVLNRGKFNGSTWSFGEIDGSYSQNVHADIQDLKFDGNGNLIIACDGGIYRSTDPSASAPSYVDISDDLQVGTTYGMGTSPTDENVIITGLIDDGSVFTTNATSYPNSWTYVNAGDGAQCLIDNVDPKIMYSTYLMLYSPFGSSNFKYTTDSWASASDISVGDAKGYFGSRWCHTIGSDNLLYAITNDIWQWNGSLTGGFTNAGRKSNFSGDFPTEFPSPSGPIVSSVAFGPNNYIYATASRAGGASSQSFVFRSSFGGGTGTNCSGPCWINVSPTVISSGFTISAAISGVAVSNTDHNHLFITCSGYVADEKVFESTDGGTSWTNISTGIDDNLPVNCIVYENGSNDGIYIGTDDGVYYKNNTMSVFEPFFDDKLPHTIIHSLIINYRINKIRAGTFGRGIWQSPLVCPNEIDASWEDINLPNSTITAGKFVESYNTLTSTEYINTTDKVTYRATKEINLEPGFETEDNSDFVAFIHGCDEPGNSTPLRKAKPIDKSSAYSVRESNELFFVYPNPNTGSFNIEFSKGIKKPSNIEVYNLIGKQVYNKSVGEENKLELNLSSYGKGLYLVKGANDNKASTVKVILQ